MKILVTGATGFIGEFLLNKLSQRPGFSASGTTRVGNTTKKSHTPLIPVGSISEETNWSEALRDVHTVIHLAARAHVLGDQSNDPLSEFRRVNVEGALRLAHQAITAGVKRFIFISSIGVNGSHTSTQPFSESTPTTPHAHYARSKLEAEEKLRALVQGSTMELVIIRPPLVYAAHAPGNFGRLLKLVKSGLPLPFGATSNLRSMISLENLADFIILCIDHPAAANQLFLISDGVEISTPAMVKALAAGMGRRPYLLPIPDKLMRWVASLLGKEAIYTQLCSSLVINSSKASTLLGWSPQTTPEESLFKAGQDYQRLRTARS